MIATVPPSMATWLASARSALVVDAYTIITVTGTVARWIGADFDFTVPDVTARSFVRGPLFVRGQVKQTVGLSVDNLSLKVYPNLERGAVMLGAQTLLQAAQVGLLRGATLQLERLVFASGLNDYQGLWVEFAGTLAVKSTAGGIITADVLSELNLLDKPMPPDVYQAQCKNTLFDSGCGLNRTAWRVPGIADAAGLSGLTAKSGFASSLGQGPGWFDQGTVQFLTGANAGVKRTVKSFNAGTFAFALPWPQTIVTGDTFEAYPGCSRSKDTCQNKFNNLLRFRGEPFIPQPETVN